MEAEEDPERNRNVRVEYLPLPRSKESPNVRGGATAMRPIAPNDRLDVQNQKALLLSQMTSMSIYELLINLGLRELLETAKPKLDQRE